MSTPTNHWKLGLFVVASLILGLLAIMVVAGRAMHEQSVRYTSYFDEAVTGLNNGSPVSYRGVTVGHVSQINIAPDRRHVEIRYELGYAELARLGLASGRGDETRIQVPEDLRIQVASSGVTGTKYLQIDFFNAATHPPPELPFDVPRHYIPAAPSTFKSLESSVMQAVDQFPELARHLQEIAVQVNGLVGEVRAQRLPEQAGETLNHASALLAVLHKKIDKLPLDELSGDARALLVQANATLGRADALIARLDSDRGLLASVQRASDSVGDVAGNANDVVVDMGSTMRDLRETIDAVRSLAQTLERDSDMLVKGRARPNE
jgi:phospholipid/cholesterol/gamma-HCH transport system substrate-binding protein